MDRVIPPPRRCFAAIALPPEIAEALHHAVAPWRTAGLRGAWVPQRNYHLTLRFFGNLTEETLEAVAVSLARDLAGQSGPRLCLSGFGAFPGWKGPAVLWAGLETRSGDLGPAVHAAEKAAAAAGLAPASRLFDPHVTWLRPRDFQPTGAPPWPAIAARPFRSDEFTVRAVALWESRREPGGTAYRPIREYPLT